jgi:hypothetical protein
MQTSSRQERAFPPIRRWQRMMILVCLIATIGIGIWWYWQPPAPSVVATHVMEAIRRGDAQTLYYYTCTEERERITLEQLQRILNAIHQRFPELSQSSEVPVAYRPSTLTEIIPSDYCFLFLFKHLTEKNQLIACSAKEVDMLGKSFIQSGRLPEGYIRFTLCVSSQARGRHRCALVMQGLVLCVLPLSLSKNFSDEGIKSLINEIFVANGVQVVQWNSQTGTMRRLDQIKLFRNQSGRRGFEW